MAIPLALMATGTVLQVAGTYSANISQAHREKRSAQFFEEQTAFARDAMFRELQIAERQYSYRLGAQISAAARGGVETGSGSVTNVFANTIALKIDELIAIKRKGELDMKLSALRGQGAMETANTLASDSLNLLQGSATIINNIAKSSDSWATRPTQSAGKTSVIQPGSGYYDDNNTRARTA